MMWTTEMNINVMRCYFTATHLETINTGYRFELHRLFIQIYPQLADQITEQRLIDQKRVIIKNKRLTTHEIEQIKEEIVRNRSTNEEEIPQTQTYLHQSPTQSSLPQPSTQHTPHSSSQLIPYIQETTVIQNHTNTESNSTQHIKDKLREEMKINTTKWENSDPTKRFKLPKLQFKQETKYLLNIMNEEIITEYLEDTSSLEQIQTIVYAAALAII